MKARLEIELTVKNVIKTKLKYPTSLFKKNSSISMKHVSQIQWRPTKQSDTARDIKKRLDFERITGLRRVMIKMTFPNKDTIAHKPTRAV